MHNGVINKGLISKLNNRRDYMIYIERKCIDVCAPKRRYIYIVKRGREILKTFKSKRLAFDYAEGYDAWDLSLVLCYNGK
jgi:hypothetical protein